MFLPERVIWSTTNTHTHTCLLGEDDLTPFLASWDFSSSCKVALDLQQIYLNPHKYNQTIYREREAELYVAKILDISTSATVIESGQNYLVWCMCMLHTINERLRHWTVKDANDWWEIVTLNGCGEMGTLRTELNWDLVRKPYVYIYDQVIIYNS